MDTRRRGNSAPSHSRKHAAPAAKKFPRIFREQPISSPDPFCCRRALLCGVHKWTTILPSHTHTLTHSRTHAMFFLSLPFRNCCCLLLLLLVVAVAITADFADFIRLLYIGLLIYSAAVLCCVVQGSCLHTQKSQQSQQEGKEGEGVECTATPPTSPKKARRRRGGDSGARAVGALAAAKA